AAPLTQSMYYAHTSSIGVYPPETRGLPDGVGYRMESFLETISDQLSEPLIPQLAGVHLIKKKGGTIRSSQVGNRSLKIDDLCPGLPRDASQGAVFLLDFQQALRVKRGSIPAHVPIHRELGIRHTGMIERGVDNEYRTLPVGCNVTR